MGGYLYLWRIKHGQVIRMARYPLSEFEHDPGFRRRLYRWICTGRTS